MLEPMEAVEAEGNVEPEGELARQLVDVLRLNADSSEQAMSVRQIREVVKGRSEEVTRTLAELRTQPETGVRFRQQGNAHLYWWEDLSGTVEVDFRTLEED